MVKTDKNSNMLKYLLTITHILFCSIVSVAQVTCFAKVELDRSDVYIQQPFKITYTVLTATWYTQPLEFDNVQIPAAFVIPFTRAQPGRFTDKGKDYSGVQFYFIVFPYKTGVFSVPAITITAVTPPEGSATGSKVVLHTRPVSFVVKPVPKNLPAGEDWLVARDVLLSSHWNKPLTNLKVGDVVERTITIDASGTLPQFIPPLADSKVSWAEVYPGKVLLRDTRDEFSPNGERTQTASWLLTEAGNFTLPEAGISWWNPYAARMYTRTVPAVTLKVAPNPELGMLTTLKDSLAKTASPATAAKKGPLLVAGIIWYKALGYGVAGLLVTGLLLKLAIYLPKKIKNTWKHYQQSEAYWFRRFIRTTAYNANVSTNFYHWWDRWLLPGRKPDVGTTLKGQGETVLTAVWTAYKAGIYGEQAPGDMLHMKKKFRRYRRHYKRSIRKWPSSSSPGKDKL